MESQARAIPKQEDEESTKEQTIGMVSTTRCRAFEQKEVTPRGDSLQHASDLPVYHFRGVHGVC